MYIYIYRHYIYIYMYTYTYVYNILSTYIGFPSETEFFSMTRGIRLPPAGRP